MRRVVSVIVLVLSCVSVWPAVVGVESAAAEKTVDNLALRRKQLDQQSARAMAQKLVATAIEAQLRQLEDNGLTDLPVYKEIKGMQGNLSALVETEMAHVVKILLDAQGLKTAEAREQKFVEARTEIRTIVIKLAVERQNLLRRLKTAEIVEQAKRLIAIETQTMTTTKRLPEESQTTREQLAVKTIEDQRDVKQLFLHLVETLADVSQWGGAIGDGAINGLRVLKTADVGKHLDRAGVELEAARYSPATTEQAAVIEGLKKLLEILIKTQGAIGTDTQSLMERVQQIAQQQAAIRQQLQQADLANLQQVNELVEEQNKIRDQLQNVAEQLPEDSSAEKPLLQAIEAAAEAAEDIFTNQKLEAMQDQRQVEGNLAVAQQELTNAAGSELEAKSADELAEMVADLQATRDQLQQVAKQEEQAVEIAAKDTAEAAKLADAAESAFDALEKAIESRELPDALKAQLAETGEAVEEAAAAPVEKSQPGDQAARQPLEMASDALERVLASTDEALAEAQRMQLAVKIGELARAAEALERAAAAEREISDETSEMVRDNAAKAASAKELVKEQADIAEVVKDIAEGVQKTAPAVVPELQEAFAAAHQVTKPLEQLNEAATQADVAHDQAAKAQASKNADQMKAAQAAERAAQQQANAAAQQAASKSDRAAEEIAQAAKGLRKEIAKAADQLAKLANQQLAEVAAAQVAVDEAARVADSSLAERMQQIAKAQEKVAEAAMQQQKAAGRPEAAQAMQLAREIGAAQAQQDDAEAAAAQLAKGAAKTPLEATSEQQQVADAAQKLTETAAARPAAQKAKQAGQPDPLTQALQQAQQAAAEAAKQTLDGKPQQASAAREQVEQALQAAKKLAAAEMAELAQAPATAKPDAQAQKAVAQAAKAAQELAEGDAGEAAATLKDAGEAASEAMKALEDGQPANAAAAQEDTAKALDQADKQLAEALDDLLSRQANQLAAQASQSDKAAMKAAKVDASAAAAAKSAQKAAEHGADQLADTPEAPAGVPPEQSAERAIAAAAETQDQLERAAADLAAKEQQLKREEALAEAIGKLAESQQQAAEQIVAAREAIEQMPAEQRPAKDKSQDPAAKPSEAQQKAARDLAKAMQQFAQAQQLTGEGAVELSGQEEVANEPIREALELASALLADMPEPPNGPEPLPLAQAEAGKKPDAPRNPAQASQPPRGQEQDLAQTSPGSESDGQSTELGTGFVPNAPEKTAQLMAGPEALEQLAAAKLLPSEDGAEALAAAEANSAEEAVAQESNSPSSSQQARKSNAEQSKSQSSKAAAESEGGKASKDGSFTENEKTKDAALAAVDTSGPAGDSRTPDSKDKDRSGEKRELKEAPWFAKLPPELRNAIRANSQRRAPRAYEERLQRYFESLE